MNFPSEQFDDVVAELCHGTAADDCVAQLHQVLRTSELARDAYLWHVELHSHLASIGLAPTGIVSVIDGGAPRSIASRSSWPSPATLVKGALAAGVLLVVVFAAGFWTARIARERARNVALHSQPDVTPQEGDGDKASASDGEVGSTMGIYRENVQFVAALDAPIIVGTGRLEPIELGAHVPYSQDGSTLHLWDWSKSPKSRVFKDTRLWAHERVALSPDGRWLVWASGKVLDLTTEEHTKIDLGGEYYFDHVGGKLERIQQLQFTPDGKRLAVLVSNLVLAKSDHPLRKQDFSSTASIQLVEFPAATLVGEVAAGFPVAFSPTGGQIVFGSPAQALDQQILQRNLISGELVRKYQPHVLEFACALCLAPDESRLAVFDGKGEVLLWDTATGELKHRLDVRQVINSTAVLRFSPDGKHLAIGAFEKTFVMNVATGVKESTTPTHRANQIQWSADGKTFLVICTARGMAEGRDKAGRHNLSNIYPSVQVVDFEAERAK